MPHAAAVPRVRGTFWVIKVGGGVIEDSTQLQNLCSSLGFMRRNGLKPIVIHGAGPQLNGTLEERGIVSDYGRSAGNHPGNFVRCAQGICRSEPTTRRSAEYLGTPAQFIDMSTFEAEFKDEAQNGFVGDQRK